MTRRSADPPQAVFLVVLVGPDVGADGLGRGVAQAVVGVHVVAGLGEEVVIRGRCVVLGPAAVDDRGPVAHEVQVIGRAWPSTVAVCRRFWES